MASLKEYSTTTSIFNNQFLAQSQQQQHNLSSTTIQSQQPIPLAKTTTTPPPTLSLFMRRLFGIVFCCHLLLITILVIVLTVRGLGPNNNRGSHFHPTKWYPPLLASTACAAILALVSQSLVGCSPSTAFKAAFWLSPLLTFATALLLLAVSSSGSLAVGIVFLVCSVVLALYGCWARPRFEYGIRVLTVAGASPPSKSNALISLSVLVATVYSCLAVTGIGGARAKGKSLDALFVSIIVISLVWTMQVVRGTTMASVSRVKFMSLAFGIDINTRVAFRDTLKHLMGSVCLGSFLVPILGVVWGSARAIKLVGGDTEEFLFSCANCYAGLASAMVMYANRWGFVHVGVYNKGFVQASKDVWDMFRKTGIESLIYSDLTGSFCFLSGVATGAICSLVSGSWALIVQKSYATELSLFAFLIGYFMSRIALAWQQACLTAYYVAYAENSQSPQFDSTIPARIQELQRVQA